MQVFQEITIKYLLQNEIYHFSYLKMNFLYDLYEKIINFGKIINGKSFK